MPTNSLLVTAILCAERGQESSVQFFADLPIF